MRSYLIPNTFVLVAAMNGSKTMGKLLPNDIYSALAASQRQRLCFWSICCAFFIPWILFCITFATMSFDLHYRQPMLAWSMVGCFALVVFFVGCVAVAAVRAKRSGDQDRKPSWIVFIALSMLVSLLLAIVFGVLNLRHNTK